MAVSELQVQTALKELVDPNTHKDYVSTKSARNIKIDGGAVSVDILLGYPAQSQLAVIKQQIEDALKTLPGVTAATANVSFKIVSHSVQRGVKLIPNVKNIIAVASGKGGVGKSTVAVNLALGFQAIGLKAGILDADIYGPSQPRLLGISGRPAGAEGKRLLPLEGYGLKAMSMGFMVEEGTPIVWRGPMVVGALNQMLREVVWGDLDVLVIDMPPGTGDVQLTMAQQVPLAGAVIVSTPQDLALIDARKGLAMFKKVSVPLLGIVENMSDAHLLELRPRGAHLRRGRRRAHVQGLQGRIPRRAAARRQHPCRYRFRQAVGGVRPERPRDRNLQADCAPGCC